MKTCKHCKNELPLNKQHRKFCSLECYYNNGGAGGQIPKERRGFNKDCAHCNQSFYVPQSQRSAKYCSIFCASKGKENKNIVSCRNCNKQIIRRASMIHNLHNYCSNECYLTFKNNTALDAKQSRLKATKKRALRSGIKTGTGLKTLRKNIFLFKTKQCEACGYNEHNFCLDMHHKDGDPRNNDLSNIVILCCICHRKLHKHLLSINDIKPIIDVVKEAESLIK